MYLDLTCDEDPAPVKPWLAVAQNMSLADAPLDELLDPSARDEGGRLWRARCLDGSAAATSAAAYEVFCAIAAKASWTGRG